MAIVDGQMADQGKSQDTKKELDFDPRRAIRRVIFFDPERVQPSLPSLEGIKQTRDKYAKTASNVVRGRFSGDDKSELPTSKTKPISKQPQTKRVGVYR